MTRRGWSWLPAILAAPLAAALIAPPPAAAQLGPICPGDGDEVVAAGATDGWCDFLFTPDGVHVHCKWAGFSVIATEFGGVIRCRRVYADGTQVNPDPQPPADAGPLPPAELNGPGE